MTWAQRDAGTISRLTGERSNLSDVVIRRTGPGLKVPESGKPVSNELRINGTFAIGATSIDLDAASIRGTLGKGWQMTIAGDVTTYEVGADVVVASDALASVTVSPALVAQPADDAVVTLTRAYGERTYKASRRSYRQDEIDNENIHAQDYRLLVATLGATDIDIDVQSDVVVFDGERVKVRAIEPYKPGGYLAGYRIHVNG